MEIIFWIVLILVVLFALAGCFGWDVAAAVVEAVTDYFGGDD